MLDTIVTQLEMADRLGDWLAPLRRDYRPWPAPAQPLVIPDPIDLDGLHGIIKVYYIRRHDGSVYATTKNRNLYGEYVLAVDDVKPSSVSEWRIASCPMVNGRLRYWMEKVKEKWTSPRK